MINKELNIQYDIMTEEQKNENGYYVPDLDILILEAPNEEMKKAWIQVQELIEETKNDEFLKFEGFTFRCIYTHKKDDGTYTIHQTTERSERDLVKWIKKVDGVA